MKAAIIDYGVGNIRSVTRVLESSEAVTGTAVNVSVTRDINDVKNSDFLVLPGVGSYSAAATHLAAWRSDLAELISSGIPTLAVCLGLQLLFEESDEGPGQGLGVFSGSVTKLNTVSVPQMGWNTIDRVHPSYELIEWAYFAHSFACRPLDESIIAGTTTYEDDTYPSIIRTESILATQFHPEKSDVVGIKLVHNFMKDVTA